MRIMQYGSESGCKGKCLNGKSVIGEINLEERRKCWIFPQTDRDPWCKAIVEAISKLNWVASLATRCKE